jgi:hypothetical protein
MLRPCIGCGKLIDAGSRCTACTRPPRQLRGRPWRRMRERSSRRRAGAGQPVTDVDHVIPVSEGGSDSIDNLQLACPRCNRSGKGQEPTLGFAWPAAWDVTSSSAHSERRWRGSPRCRPDPPVGNELSGIPLPGLNCAKGKTTKNLGEAAKNVGRFAEEAGKVAQQLRAAGEAIGDDVAPTSRSPRSRSSWKDLRAAPDPRRDCYKRPIGVCHPRRRAPGAGSCDRLDRSKNRVEYQPAPK